MPKKIRELKKILRKAEQGLLIDQGKEVIQYGVMIFYPMNLLSLLVKMGMMQNDT